MGMINSPGVYSAFLVIFEAERLAFRLFMAALCIHLLRAAWHARPRPLATPKPLNDDRRAHWPFVTVQLPLRNEVYVAERVMRAVAAMDYPRDRMEIQVIDTSTDQTIVIVDRVAQDLRAKGALVEVIRGTASIGNKGGSLALGLKTAKGEFIAVFDADCVPRPDFLRRALPFFDERVGLVQGRGSFLNGEASLLTRVQALLLDALMLVDQTARSRLGSTFQFNGSGGVWRRACIDEAGGWRSSSITEDLELSCSALLGGWRFIHEASIDVPTEVPEDILAFRAQQRRWTRGGMHVLRTLARRVVASDAPLSCRIGVIVHLVRKVLYVLLAILTITYPLTTFSIVQPLIRYSVPSDALLFVAVISSIAVYLLQGRRLAGRGALKGAVLVPFAIACSFGMSFTHAVALLRGLFHTDAEFERTPKFGGSSKVGAERRYRSRIEMAAFLELAIGAAYVAFSLRAFGMHLYLHASFMTFVAMSYLWVGIMTLIAIVRTLRAARNERAKSSVCRPPLSPPLVEGEAPSASLPAAPALTPEIHPRPTSSPPR